MQKDSDLTTSEPGSGISAPDPQPGPLIRTSVFPPNPLPFMILPTVLYSQCCGTCAESGDRLLFSRAAFTCPDYEKSLSLPVVPCLIHYTPSKYFLIAQGCENQEPKFHSWFCTGSNLVGLGTSSPNPKPHPFCSSAVSFPPWLLVPFPFSLVE